MELQDQRRKFRTRQKIRVSRRLSGTLAKSSEIFGLMLLALIEDNLVLILGDGDFPAGLLSDVVAKTLCAFGLAVYNEHAPWRGVQLL